MLKLNSKYYSIWKTLMEDKLYNKGLHDFIKGNKFKRVDKSDAK